MAGKKKRPRDGLWLRGRIYWTSIGGERVSTGCKDREAARVARARLEREAADPAHAASRRTKVGDMIAHVLADRKTAKGKTGGTLAPESLGVWETKLGHWARMLGIETPLAEVDYDAVGRGLDQREVEGASQHTRSKELAALRFGLRLEKQRGAYPHDVDHVTRTHRFAVGYKPRKRHLTWEEIPKLLAGLLQETSQRVPKERLDHAKYMRGNGQTLASIAAFLECSVSTVKRYLDMPDPEPSEGASLRAQHAAWIIATGGRRKESYGAEAGDHNVALWQVRIRGTKTGEADRVIPIAPPYRALLIFALAGRPSSGPIFPHWANVGRSLKLACARAGIERVSPNDLRRTHSSLLRQAGIALEDLAPIMGHTTTRMLELVYGRTNVEALGRALDKVPEHDVLPSTIPAQPLNGGTKTP